MDRNEFDVWARDFAARFPVTGQWLRQLAKETRDVWFDDCFSDFDLRDVLAVNSQLMQDGELQAYERERIPSMFLKRVGAIRFERLERERQVQQQRRQTTRTGRTARIVSSLTPDLASVVATINAAQRRHRDEHDERMPDELVSQMADTLMADDVDDEERLPRFKCANCHDSGYARCDSAGRHEQGACSCETGLARRDAWASAGRVLGLASRDVTSWDVPD